MRRRTRATVARQIWVAMTANEIVPRVAFPWSRRGREVPVEERGIIQAFPWHELILRFVGASSPVGETKVASILTPSASGVDGIGAKSRVFRLSPNVIASVAWQSRSRIDRRCRQLTLDPYVPIIDRPCAKSGSFDCPPMSLRAQRGNLVAVSTDAVASSPLTPTFR